MLLLLGIGGSMAEIGVDRFYGVLGRRPLVRQAGQRTQNAGLLPARAFELFHQHAWIGSVILVGLLLGFFRW